MLMCIHIHVLNVICIMYSFFSQWQGLTAKVVEFGTSVLGQPLFMVQLGYNCTGMCVDWCA